MSKLKKQAPVAGDGRRDDRPLRGPAGTAYAAQTINGGAIKKQTIGAGKIKHKTLTGYQININKLGTVPSAKSAIRASHTYWAVVNNPASPGNATLARASDPGIARGRGRRRRQRHLPGQRQRLRRRRRPQQRRHHRAGSGLRADEHLAANPNAIEVHTRDKPAPTRTPTST